MKLCAFHPSPMFPDDVLVECPLGLTAAERDVCSCRDEQRVWRFNHEHRVQIAESTRQKARLRADTSKIEQHKRNQAATNPTEKPTMPAPASSPATTTPNGPATAAAPAATKSPAPNAAPTPLWPVPLPIMGVTGEYASGKTLFGLTIDPPHTLCYDWEKSSLSYTSLGFERIDVPSEMLKQFPKSRAYKPIDTFNWWRDHVRAIEPGRYRVIVLDPASEIESGATDWVRANPNYFGRTAAQYQQMSGLMWGDMKELWKSILADLASRCETFVFAVHMGDKFEGNKATGKRKPKGKSTLMELASLYLLMERKPDPKGVVAPKPAATVLKSRLAHTQLNPETGEVEIIPALPPRLPEATPSAIRRYLLNPPDYTKLKPGERVQEEKLSEDELAAMRLATAEAERDAAALQLERETKRANAPAPARASGPASKAAATPAAQPPTAAPAATATAAVPAPSANGQAVASAAPAATSSPAPAAVPAPDKARPDQLDQLAKYRAELFAKTAPDADDAQKAAIWRGILAKRNVTTARDLTPAQADELLGTLGHRLTILEMQEKERAAAPAASAGGF